MRPFILSDETIYHIKEIFERKMSKGLDNSSKDIDALPMKITFVTDRFKGSESGNFVAVCAHAHNFTITLVKLKQGASPEIYKKHYTIDPNVYKKPYIKIYDAFARRIKDFFLEYNLDGEIIPSSFCTNLSMEQYSLDTAVIPHFIFDSKIYCSQRDIKASFERVLRKDKYQDETNFIKTFKSDDVGSITGTSDTDRVYHSLYDAKLLGVVNVQGLETTSNVCHNLLVEFQKVAVEIGEPAQKILLDVSHAGVKVLDKVFKTSLHQHPIHKITCIVQDFQNAYVFGYLFGDFLKGHQFFGFKTDKNSTEVVSLLRNIFAVELIRKKKEKLEMQASQVFITLKNFLNLATELKLKEEEIPDLLKQRVGLVKNINWWLEGCVEEAITKFVQPKESVLHVRLQELYAAAQQLKQIKIEREEAARLAQEKLSGKRHRRKKKRQTDIEASKDHLEEEIPLDPLLVKVSEIVTDNIKYIENAIGNQEQQLSVIKENLEIVNDKFDFNIKHENLNDMRDFCFTVFNIWNQEYKSLENRIETLMSHEESERGKIPFKIPSIYIGKKQYLRVTKKLFKVSIFEDTDFTVPKREGKSKSELLNKILVCEDYFLNSLKMRREEVEDLNYFISGLHFRETISNPEDSEAIDYCRRLFVKGVKMRLKEIQDIEVKLNQLKNMKKKISTIMPDTFQFIYNQFQLTLEKRKSNTRKIENLLSKFAVNLQISEDNITMCLNVLVELKMLIENDVVDIKKHIADFGAKVNSIKNITNICLQLYNQTLKMRKKEFDIAVSDLDMFETVVVHSYTKEEAELIHHCQEEYLTSACMREKEIETLEFQMETVDKKFKIEDSQTVTLKELFYAALEMEKCECYRLLQSPSADVNESNSDRQMLPVVFSFKNLYDVVALYLKDKNSDSTLFVKDPQIYVSLRQFLTAAFELKQKEIEIPLSVLKKDLANILIELLEEVKKRQKQELLKQQIREQALKISRSWKEVFLVAMGIREKEMENIIETKRKEIKEEKAVLHSLEEENNENIDNKVNQVVMSWKRIFSIVIELKDSEIEQVNQLLKRVQTETYKDQKENFISKPGAEITNVDDDEEEYLELDDSDTPGKETSPVEEIQTAVTACKEIYNIAVDKGSAQLEEMEYEMRPIFSVEFDAEKVDVLEDEVGRAVNKFCLLISDLAESIKTDVSSLKVNMESLLQIEENIKSQAASAKATCTHFLTLLLELEEQAVQATEGKLEELNNAFEIIQSEDAETFRPFTDLFVDVLSEKKLITDSEATQEESQATEESKVEEEDEDVATNNLTKEEIQAFLLEIESELKTDNDEDQHQRKAVLDVFNSCKVHLEYVVEVRNQSIESIQFELERLKLPDPKKMKPKEKVQRALEFITSCKKFFASSISSRQLEVKYMCADVEKMKATQNKEQIVVEYDPSEIVSSCKNLFQSAVEARKKNILMMNKEIESVEGKTPNVADDIKPEALSLMKSEIYVTCKDLVLESVDLKMKEIDDIASYCEHLNGIELKIGIQLKQLDPDKQKTVCTKLEKAKDAVATCKKLCCSAAERAKKEVQDTEEELRLLKGALESSETSLITATCKNVLMTAVEKRESEIADIQNVLYELIENVQDLLIKLDNSNLMANEDLTIPEKNLNSGVSQKESESDLQSESDAGVEADVHTEKDNLSDTAASNDAIDMEQICKMKISMVTDFFQECKETISTNIQKLKDEIANLESDLDKLKVTVQKVEGEDSQVFSICNSLFDSTIEMRREEMQTFQAELKTLERIYQDKAEALPTSQKSDTNPEETEVGLAISSCKRVLNLAIKNRKSEKDAADFELMKLVRFQDSRIGNLSKQFLLTTGQKSCEEMRFIKTKLLRIEGLPLENEIEILNATIEVLKKLFQATKEQIDSLVLDLQILVKKKMQMEIEESQFVFACRGHFSSHIQERQREITLMRQELESVSESQSFEEGFDIKVINVKLIDEQMYKNAISMRKKEIEAFQFELIKHYDIKVSEEVSACEGHLLAFIEDLKNELNIYESEAEAIENAADEEKDVIWTTFYRLQKFYSTTLKRRMEYFKTFEEELKLLQGKNKATEKERKFDVKAPLKQEAVFDKLKTDASVAISTCKDIPYSIIELAESEIRDINVAREEMMRQETGEEITQKKEQAAFSFQDENSKFTEKEIALLQAIEQDSLYSKSTKNRQVMEFCEQFFEKSINNLGELIHTTKQYIQKLSSIEEELALEASKIVHFMSNLVGSVIQEQVKEKKMLQTNLQLLKDMNLEKKNEILQTCQEMVTNASAYNKEILAVMLLSVDSIKMKEEELQSEINMNTYYSKSVQMMAEQAEQWSFKLLRLTAPLELYDLLAESLYLSPKVYVSKVYRNCGDLFYKMLEMIDIDMKHLANDLEELKKFGLPEEEEESKLSEDERAIKKCKTFLLVAIDNRKKLSHSISLELKFLKGGIQEMRIKDAKVFPSWCERFLAFLDIKVDEAAFYNNTDISSSFLPNGPGKTEPHPIKSTDSEECAQKLENYKDLLKSFEQKQQKQPIYTISSWDDLLLRSYLLDQIEKYSLKLDGKHLSHTVDDIKRDKNWEDIFFEANLLLEKQLSLSAKLKDKKQLFMPISSWSEVLYAAIDEWNVIVKEKGSLLKNESLLLQWRGKIKSKENQKYSSGFKYGLQVTKLHDYAKHWRNKNSESFKELSSVDIPDCGLEVTTSSYIVDTQDNLVSSAAPEEDKVHEHSSSWSNLFTKSVELMEEGRKAYNFMRKKDTKLQSEVISLFSTWDQLFSRAIEQQRIDLQEEMKESNVLKDLAKVVNEEVQGIIKKPLASYQEQKIGSWLQIIFESSETCKSELLNALNVKKREMEKLSKSAKVDSESTDFSIMNIDPEALLNEGKKLFMKALEIRKDEIKRMEKELKLLNSISESKGNSFKEIPEPILIWKLIVSVAVNFKASGLKFEPKAKKKFSKSPKDLFAAALKSKMKELESYENYWKKFTEKKFFLDIIPASVSWSDSLVSISQLAKKDIAKMSMFGIKVEQEEKEQSDTESNLEDNLDKNQEVLEDSACWTDLVLEALEQGDKNSEYFSNISFDQENEFLLSWDEIFFFMDQMCKEIIKESIFNKKVDVDYRKLEDIRCMVSSNFFSWDILITGVIEEMLFAIYDESDNDGTFDSKLESGTLSCLIDTPRNLKGSHQKNISLQDILKKIGIKSFTQLLPSQVGVVRLEMEDILNETRKKVLAPAGTIFKKEFNEDTAWRCIFPIAVEVWCKKLENYLNFQDPFYDRNTEMGKVEPKVTTTELSDGGVIPDPKYSDPDLKSLKKLEKEIAFEYISGVEENVNKKYIQFDADDDHHTQSSIGGNSISPIIIEDMKKMFKSGESMSPEYFNVSASWQEIFKAAFERYKHFLCGVIDLQEIKDDFTEIYLSKTVGKPHASEEKKLEYQAINVLNKKITLQDVFEIVDSLKKKNLVLYKEIKKKEELSEVVPTITLENLEVSDVIGSFRKIFIKAFKCRNREKSLLEQESEKLILVSQTNCEKYRALPVIRKLIQYYQTGVEPRSKENESINLKLESLNEFKCIFSGYLECPVTESLLKRNIKRVEEMNYLSDHFEQLKDNFLQKLKVHFNNLKSTFESYMNRRMEKMELVDLNHAKKLYGNLDSENQLIFANSKNIFSSVINLRKEEVEAMAQYLLDWRKMFKFDDSLENTTHKIFKSVLTFFDDEIFERKNVINLMIQEKDIFLNKKSDLKSKISLVYDNCKNFLLIAVDNRKNEIHEINSRLLSVKNMATNPNKKSLEVISLFEECCLKFIEKRELEIQLLENHIDKIKEAEISEVQSVCIEYFSQASLNRKSELKIIEDQIESFQLFDVNVENELSEAIEEALEGIVDMSSGMTFFHALTERREDEKEKVDIEIVKKCSEIFAHRAETVKEEIKAIEESSEILKFFKGDVALVVISVLDAFEVLLDDGLQAIKLDIDSIFSEQNIIKTHQSQFFSEVVECLMNCKKHFDENLDEIERDIYILQLQLNILYDEQKDEYEEDVLDYLNGDVSGSIASATEDNEETSKPSLQKSSKQDVDTTQPEESSLVTTSYAILNSALEFRLNFIGMFSNEIKSLIQAENKAYEVLTVCTDNVLKAKEMHTLEKEKIEDVLSPVNNVAQTGIVYTCIECLSCLLQYDVDCLTALMPDCDRLKCTILNMDQKRSAIFDYCNESLQTSIDARASELEFMNSEVMCMECMQTPEDSQYVTSSKLIFQKGIENRDSELANMKNILENLKSSTEILPVVNVCRMNLQTSVKNRKEEISAINAHIEILETEAAMLLLVYAPALENIIDGNKQALVDLIPAVQKLNRISRELVSEEEKIIEACKKLYCNILETLKIEREAIKFDIDSIQEVELESKEMIDTEGKELIVSFKDLYLAAFDDKKSVLEKDIRKRNIEENVKMKKVEITENISKGEQDEPVKENEIEYESKESFERFIEYYDIKKEKRRSMIDDKIMDEFEAIEKMLMIQTGDKESFDMARYSEESIEDVEEAPSKAEQSFNRVYEVKLKEIEEDIKYKQEKITGVINNRKSLMESIVMEKKRKLEENITVKQKEMRDAINSIKGKESNAVCSLNDLYREIELLKTQDLESLLMHSFNKKSVIEELQTFYVSVKLENFIDIVLEIKEAELEMMLQSKYKDIDRLVSIMKKEIEKLIAASKEKLDEAVQQYRRSEKSKAMEYAVSGTGTSHVDSYTINENDIFPDIKSFEQFIESFKDLFAPQSKKPCIYEDKTFRSEEILKNNPEHIPLFRKHFPFKNYVPNHVLKLLDVEITSLIEILFDMNVDKARVILQGLSFISADSAIHDVAIKKSDKAILLDIVAVLNDSTSMLVLGSFMNEKCDISLNLDKDCSLVYFEKTEDINKWNPILENVQEVAVDIGLKTFGENGCLDDISTKFDWAVTTVPVGLSRFERFISDIGLLEQIKFAFLELHHNHLLCRNCNFTNNFKDSGLSIDHISRLLSSKHMPESTELLPLSSGTPTSEDLSVAKYVSKIILMRGAILTAVCLSAVLQRLKKKEIAIITTSFFIQESHTYRKMLETFLSALCPETKVKFIFCKKSSCGIGASIMASVASWMTSETPGLYLLELQERLKNRNKLFSIQSFLKLLSNPTTSTEAIQLAKNYMEEMKFDLPLAVVWAYYFINEDIAEAEAIYKLYPVSLSKVSHLVCRKICLTKNIELAETYIKFLKTYKVEQHVKEYAYKTLLDLLFYKDMYQEAIAFVQECIKDNIPLAKLRHSTLTVLHDFCSREANQSTGISSFSLPIKDSDSSSSDSDKEDRITQ